MAEDMERVAAEVPSELKQAIRMEAARRGESMAAVVREVLKEEFDPDESGGGSSDSSGSDGGRQVAAATLD